MYPASPASSSHFPRLCFASLAFGREYRFHAERLALDFAVRAPHFSFLLMVDAPHQVTSRPNLQLHPYRPEGALRRYHDKRLLIRAGLEAGHETVVVIDANSRLVETLPPNLSLKPGINAFQIQPLEDHLREEEALQASRRRRFSARHQRSCLEKAATQLGLKLHQVTFLQESIYAVHGPRGDLEQFVELWGRLGQFMDYHGLAWSEGFAIGLAAAAVGLPIHENRFLPMASFYKHRLHGALLARGQLNAPPVFQAQEEARLLARYLRSSATDSFCRRHSATATMALRWLAKRCAGEPRPIPTPGS